MARTFCYYAETSSDVRARPGLSDATCTPYEMNLIKQNETWVFQAAASRITTHNEDVSLFLLLGFDQVVHVQPTHNCCRYRLMVNRLANFDTSPAQLYKRYLLAEYKC
jgi:hypothetical protein